MQKRHPHSGFTLLELLVATVLLSLVMSSVYMLFHTTIGAWRGIEQDSEAYQDARNVVSILQRELDNSVWRAAHLVEGDRHELTLYVVDEPLDLEEEPGRHLMRVQYTFRGGRGDGTLVREEALVEGALPGRPATQDNPDRGRVELGRPENFVLASNVRDLEFRYIWVAADERDRRQPPNWMPEVIVPEHRQGWGLPQGIELNLALADPRDPENILHFSTRMPFRVPTARLTMDALQARVGGLD